MKNPKAITIAIVAIIILLILFSLKQKVKNTPVITPEPTPIPSTPTVTPSKYSPELKAKVRNEFINTCHTKGKYSIAVCTCGADYLAVNYSQSDLAKMYLDYHTTNVAPKALEDAAAKCTK